MIWLDNLIVENINRWRIASPIYVGENPLDGTSVGYFPTYRLLRFPIGVQFGWNSMLMDRDCLGFVVAHEFAHIARGDLNWMSEKVALFPILRILSRVRPIARPLSRSNANTCPSQKEYEADRMAAEFYPKEALGRFLIAALAVIVGDGDLCDTGKVGGIDPVWDESKIAVPAGGFSSLSLKDSCAIILSTFRADRSAFENCANRGRMEDEPEGYHPSIQDRLSHLGLEWNTVQASCDFRPEVLLDMDEFCKWATPEFRLVSVPQWNGISVPYAGKR